MKKYILLSFCAFIFCTSSAQWSREWLNSKDNEHLLYANGDLMVGNNSGCNLGVSFVYNSKYSVEVGYSAGSNQFVNQVPVLKSGNRSSEENFINPNEMMENYNIMVGRHFNLNSKETIRCIIQGGSGISVMIDQLTKQPESNSGFEKKELLKNRDVSFMINSKLEFPITDLFGFSVGPTLIMNHEKRYLSLSVGFIYGVISKS